jgi:glycosyltransferase involved in cell wall biosynthesis
MNQSLFFSVITPSFNRVGFIRTAIESVLAQHYEPFEHIIMDGGSTDGTLELLASYPHLRVVSEPDQGLYDALNKGIGMAKGEIIGQLSSDDFYAPGIFSLIAELFSQNPEVEAVSGGARIFERPQGIEQTIMEYAGVSEEEIPYRATIGVGVFNAWFFRKTIFERIGGYSLEYPVVADSDFLIRCYLGKIKVIPLSSVIYHYLQHAESLTVNSPGNLRPLYLSEKLRLAEKYMYSKSSDGVVKRYCTEWYYSNATKLLTAFVRQRRWYLALKAIWSAGRRNPKWLFLMIAQSPVRMGNYIRKMNATQR